MLTNRPVPAPPTGTVRSPTAPASTPSYVPMQPSATTCQFSDTEFVSCALQRPPTPLLSSLLLASLLLSSLLSSVPLLSSVRPAAALSSIARLQKADSGATDLRGNLAVRQFRVRVSNLHYNVSEEELKVGCCCWPL